MDANLGLADRPNIQSNKLGEVAQAQPKKKLNLYRLKPKDFDSREDVIMFSDLRKVYNLEGREEKVVALKNVSLSPN